MRKLIILEKKSGGYIYAFNYIYFLVNPGENGPLSNMPPQFQAMAAMAAMGASVTPLASVGYAGFRPSAATGGPQAALAGVSGGKDKSRPVSSTAVAGTPWCVVWTGDNRVSLSKKRFITLCLQFSGVFLQPEYAYISLGTPSRSL